MNKLLGYLPFHFLCFLVLGILIQYYFRIWDFSLQILFFSLLGSLILLFFLRRRRGFELGLLVFFFFTGVTSVVLGDDRNFDSYFDKHICPNSIQTFVIRKVLQSGGNFDTYEANVHKVNNVRTTGKVRIYVKKDSIEIKLRVGQIVCAKSAFVPITAPLNPNQFDYRNYLSKQGIHWQVFLKTKELVILKEFQISLASIAYSIRSAIQQSLLKSGFKENEYAIMNALLLGQRKDISQDLVEDYTRAGAIHILAVSGLHVGIILFMFNFLLKPLEIFKNGKLIRIILMIVFLWLFALIAGLSASVVRAVTMFSAVAIGQVISRKNSIYNSLILSMFFLLLLKPMFLFDVGFQLSYLAVFGIVWIQPKLYAMWNPKWRIIDFYWKLSTVSMAAQCVVLPLSLYYFHQFPGLFMLSNLVIIPFLGVILFVGIISMVLSIFNLLPDIIMQAYSQTISVLNRFVRWISEQESWLFTEIPFSFEMVLGSYLILFLGFRFMDKVKSNRMILLLCSIALFQLIAGYFQWSLASKNQFIVFHKSGYSVIGERYGGDISFSYDIEDEKFEKDRLVTSYKIGFRVHMNNQIPRYFEYRDTSILIIDSKAVYPKRKIGSLVIILKDSPKINLERLLKDHRPFQVVADGSNYRNFVAKWELTCHKLKTPFWHTGQKGAYILK